jgi:hypothetical protein
VNTVQWRSQGWGGFAGLLVSLASDHTGQHCLRLKCSLWFYSVDYSKNLASISTYHDSLNMHRSLHERKLMEVRSDMESRKTVGRRLTTYDRRSRDAVKGIPRPLAVPFAIPTSSTACLQFTQTTITIRKHNIIIY